MKVKVCNGKTCTSRHSGYIVDRLERDQKFYNKKVEVIKSPCMDKCKKGPCVKIGENVLTGMNPAKVSEIVFKNKKK